MYERQAKDYYTLTIIKLGTNCFLALYTSFCICSASHSPLTRLKTGKPTAQNELHGTKGRFQ